MKSAIEINEANFQSEVLNSNQPVVVDFWAPWCGPCKMLAAVLDEIATEQGGRVKVAKVNVDEHPVLTERCGIQSIPTLLYFSDGEVQHQTVGISSKKAILEKLTGALHASDHHRRPTDGRAVTDC
jgi:thioredoxin 1